MKRVFLRKCSLLLLFLFFLTPSIGFCTIYEFQFEGVVSMARQFIQEYFPYDPPQYYVGQTVTGSLYWHSFATPGYHYGPTGGGYYSVEGVFPLLWAGINVGDTYFDLNQNAWLDIGIHNDDAQDSLHISRVHSSIFYYEGHPYIIDLPNMVLNGPPDIFNDSSYPNYLDLSLFTSGYFLFQNYSIDSGYDGAMRVDITNISAVPEPATILLFGVGIVCFFVYTKRGHVGHMLI